MLEQVLPNIYKIEVPLPGNPLQSINCYVIKSKERNLIIDTGMNRKECKADGDAVKFTERWDEIDNFSVENGFPESASRLAINSHPGKVFEMKRIQDYVEVNEDDRLDIGYYSFRFVWTPGHTRGHMCLYEPNQKVLVSGDHILDKITPNIALVLPDQGNPLNDYLLSLDKANNLDVELILPGHRNIITNPNNRIAELKHHHEMRINEIIDILENGSGDAYFAASKMSWNINGDSWEQFPDLQKWFATGEAISHLKYLEHQGKIQKLSKNETNIFSLN